MNKWFCFFASVGLLLSCKRDSNNGRHGDEDYLKLSVEDRLKPEHATQSFSVYDGLKIQLFAAEPMVVNPTNFDIDERGRVWVCESYNYAVSKENQTEPGGRISILEDTDGDGKADKKTVYYEGEDVNIALGICVLGNKVFVSRSPDILVFTDENGDDKPDKKQKLFTGMGWPGDHSVHAIVFGPDGKLYFNMGNRSGPVLDSAGKIIIDQAGNEVRQDGDDYIGGMIFRCNMDGSAFEVVGHNFRNNYEVAVDSYGNLWQSDNDDDGNKSCRINFILEYGNYGFLDEMTRQNWTAQRTNIEPEIDKRHWHQNDPGVVPNMLITGAGSPAGITVYEGKLLPEVFHGQLLHADAGPNEVRAYLPKTIGAGYEATTLNIVKSKYDQWFRPVDVCVAHDGSLFVADWYDPGVGGGAAADASKGRIFRVAPDTKKYKNLPVNISSIQNAIEALKNPNLSTRYLGWTYLHSLGDKAEMDLLKLFEGDDPVVQARAIWLLGKIPGREKHYIQLALTHQNPAIRIIGIRLARQSGLAFESLIEPFVRDSSAEVRREIAIGLHLITTSQAAEVWSELALQYDGEDRWYLEALGIGASLHWDECFSLWKQKAKENWNNKSGRDIVWRSRSSQAVPLLAELINDPSTTTKDRLRYFRAFDFHEGKEKQEVLLKLLNGSHPAQDEITLLALHHLDTEKVEMSPLLRSALNKTLASVEGTREYVALVKKYKLTDKKDALVKLVIQNGGNETGTEGVQLLLDETFKGMDLLKKASRKSDADATVIIESMQLLGSKPSLDLLTSIVLDKTYSLPVRKAAVMALGKSWPGESALLACVKVDGFDEQLKPVAGSVLFNVYRVSLQEEAAKYIPRPAASTGKQLPPIRDLVASTGNTERGAAVFSKYCKACHIVNDVGTDFGPRLSEIGDKLPKEGIFRAIMFPSEGINYDYEGYVLSMKDGSSAMGIIESETGDFVALKMMGGIKERYDVKNIISKQPNGQSLMPDLSTVMTEEELIDLVEYLTILKKDQ